MTASLVVAFVGAAFLVDFLEKRAIEYRSGREIYAKLHTAGFDCIHPFFDDNPDPEISTATCERGFGSVNISVNPQRGNIDLVQKYSRPYEGAGEAFVSGSNWSVTFGTSNENSYEWAVEVQEILGGEILESLPQEDF